MKTQNTTRVAIVSDTHAYLSPDVAAVIDSCDIVVHAGDIGSKEILERLHAGASKVIAVCGNNDLKHLWASNEASIVNSLPRVAELYEPGTGSVDEWPLSTWAKGCRR